MLEKPVAVMSECVQLQFYAITPSAPVFNHIINGKTSIAEEDE